MSDVTTIVNPATGATVAEITLEGAAEADAAVARSVDAGPGWRAVAPADRARLLRRFAAQVEENGEELAQLETANVGKPITDSRDEVAMVAEVLYFYAGAVDKHRGSTVPVAGGADMTFHEPLGVVAAIVPWNFPLAITSWKVAPALATGNTIVVKPAEITPMSALRLAELALDAGIPDGVLQVVAGKGSVLGSRLVEHPDVAKVAFTGSTEVGREVMARASGTIKRVTLELGGKSASIVFADADLEAAAAATPGGVFANAGQDCCARSRVLVQRSVLDRYLGLLAD
ncbi:MAG TPA: aldehyde dehydrogenase family protein, partial [Acidimicrobiales bacterium]|nr:aldehyde dehydrogenase family protein [Acidimicrobiales bacterium]